MQYCVKIYKVIFFTLITLGNCIFCTSFAASQGKLGARSIASVEILIHVNQTFTTAHPNELVLNPKEQSANYASHKFCVLNKGYSKNASVPYELKVETLTTQISTESSAYNVYLSDTSSNKIKYLLRPGLKIKDQNAFNQENSCMELGTNLTIEKTDSIIDSIPATPGTLLLLVSPN